MDLAIYINEFLGLHGDVYVPGLGSFAHKRINGYYNERENKFYPPRHEISFDPQPRDDDSLAMYISDKKNISPASAKYFIEKYTTGLKQQASEQKVDITGLGHLFYEYSVLTFKADKSYEANDPSFYGLAPVKAQKGTGKTFTTETPRPVEPPPIVAPPVGTSPPVVQPEPEVIATPAEEYPVTETPVEETSAEISSEDTEVTTFPEDIYEEEPARDRSTIWIVLLLILIIGLLLFSVAYQYKPEWFGKARPVDTTIIVKGPPPAPVKKDTAAKPAAPQDTSAKTTPAPASQETKTINVDTTKAHWEVFLDAFKTQKAADEMIERYKTIGITVIISPDAPGALKKLIAGSYASREEAENAKEELIKTGKVRNDIYSKEIKPKK